jgi:hypothetical protein
MRDNDGRKPAAWLPRLAFLDVAEPVVQVIEDASGEILYTIRIDGEAFQPPVFSESPHSVRAGRDRPDAVLLPALTPAPTPEAAGNLEVSLSP